MRSQKLIISFLLLATMHTTSFGQSFPKYAAMVGGKESGPIKRGEFIAQQGVRGIRFFKGNHWEPIIVDSFSLMILRDTTVILQIKNRGQIFTENVKTELKKLMANDRVIIYSIYSRDYGNKLVFIRPVEFIIE